MNYMQIEKSSVSNGTGFRVVLWVSGCSLKCAYCQNQEAWDFNAGDEFNEEVKQKMFDALSKEWIKGITFSGGHPLDSQNIKAVNSLIVEIKEKFPVKDIWLYTGLELNIDDFLRGDLLANTLSNCDVVVDGRYINDLRDVTLAFRGSSNQRMIDVKNTIINREISLYNPDHIAC